MFWAFGRALHCIFFAEKAKKDAVSIPNATQFCGK